MDAVTINYILIGIIFFLLVFLSFVWPPDSPWSPWWRTNRKTARAVCRLAKVSNKDVVYELGSGDGEFILTAAKDFHAKKAIGIEIDHARYFISVFRKRIGNVSNSEFIRSDFKKINLSDATIVYFYLVPAAIKRIMPKLKKELKKGVRSVSYKYEVEGLKLIGENKEHKLYLYEI